VDAAVTSYKQAIAIKLDTLTHFLVPAFVMLLLSRTLTFPALVKLLGTAPEIRSKT